MKRSYLRFCLYFGRTPIPASTQTILLYAAFLARSLSAGSIPSYMNIIRLLHLEQGLQNPLDNWQLRALMKGINRRIGRPPHQKLPITLDILHRVRSHLNMNNSLQATFWAACLVAFFAFLRKSTLLPKSEYTIDMKKCLCVKDVKLSDSMISLCVRHTKTIQFGQRELNVPIAAIPGSDLCPVTAVSRMLSHIPRGTLSEDTTVFCYIGVGGEIRPLTHSMFTKLLRMYLKAINVDVNQYSGHSFRRGGCSYAFKLGISPTLIKMRGDWKSNAYERYVSILPSQHMALAKALSFAAK